MIMAACTSTRVRRAGSIVSAGAVCLALALPALAAAQQPEPWLGVPVPSGHALPPQLSVLGGPAFRAPSPSVPAGEERFIELEGWRVQSYLESIVGFSAKSRERGERMWGRVSGLPGAEETAAWVARRFALAGLQDVEVQRYDAESPMWWPDEWEVRVLAHDDLGQGSRDVVLGSAVPTRGVEVPGGVLEAPLVYAGTIGAFAEVDVRGKVAVQHVRPSNSAFSLRSSIQEGGQELTRRGAVAVLNYIEQPGNMHVRDFGACGVCFNIGGEDGAFLRELSERATGAGVAGALRVRLQLDAPTRSGLTAQNVIGIVPGDSDEVVIVNAHLDGWYDAAGDNGDGLAVLIALAHHFARPENRPARTLMFVASGGHHSPGLNGPLNVVSMNPDLTARAVLVLNLEHVAQYLVDPDSWEVRPTEQRMGWGVTNMAPFLIDLTNRGVQRYGFALRPDYGSSVPGDLGRYDVLGVPRVQAIHAGPLYHTSADVFETVSVNGLERAARFYAYFIDGVARASRQQLTHE
jgi:hypothetical protein